MLSLLTSVVTLSTVIISAQGHGMMMDPPARNSAWREHFPNPTNYDDNGLNCGGFSNQWDQNNGQCGVCGDPFQGPRKHEVGYPGGFANGIIVRTYQMGQDFPVKIWITANHKGIFQFRLCQNDNPRVQVTQDCLNRNLLSDATGKTDFELLSSLGNSVVQLRLRLPSDITCNACVLQWRWTAGNNYGPPGTKQETYANCADVAITSTRNVTAVSALETTGTTTPPKPATMRLRLATRLPVISRLPVTTLKNTKRHTA